MSAWWVVAGEIVAFAYASTEPPWLIRTWEAIVEPFRRIEDWLRSHTQG